MINNMYYNSAEIITIFLHDVLCMILNNVDYMYKYSQTWKFPEQVKSCLVSCRIIRYIMVISYFVDISKGYFPNLCVLAKMISE